MEKIFERNIQHGLNGVFILGSMGEWQYFDAAFREKLIRESVRIINGRMELLVGITAPSLAGALENMEQAAGYPCTNYVFMLPTQEKPSDSVAAILKVLDAADRQVFYYHCPPANGEVLDLQGFAKIMQHPHLRGIKNSASNMWLRRELLMLKQELNVDVLLLEGQEWCIDEALIVGCDGVLCGIGALASKMMVSVAEAVSADKIKEAVAAQHRLIKLFHGVYGRNLESVWVGQKYALQLLGICGSARALAQSVDVLTPERKRKIEECVEKFRSLLE